MKRLFLLLVTGLLACSAMAQEDALGMWTTVTFDKSFGKWSAGLMSEYRHKIHDGVSKTDQYFVRPRISYKVLPWLTLRYQMDFAYSSSGFNLRFIPEVTMSRKVGNFSFSLRQRVMTTWKVEQGSNSTLLRTRAKVDYHIQQTPLTVLVAAEPYWCNFSKDSFAWFQKCRWHAGLNIKLLDNLTLAPQYIYQAYHERSYGDHIIYMTFLIKL